MGRRSEQTFLQRHTDGQEAHEKMLNIVIREMQIKTTMRYHLTPVRTANIKNFTNSKRWRGCGAPHTVGGNVNWYSQCTNGEQYGGSLKN